MILLGLVYFGCLWVCYIVEFYCEFCIVMMDGFYFVVVFCIFMFFVNFCVVKKEYIVVVYEYFVFFLLFKQSYICYEVLDVMRKNLVVYEVKVC